jgi:hypothetical protein
LPVKLERLSGHKGNLTGFKTGTVSRDDIFGEVDAAYRWCEKNAD